MPAVAIWLTPELLFDQQASKQAKAQKPLWHACTSGFAHDALVQQCRVAADLFEDNQGSQGALALVQGLPHVLALQKGLQPRMIRFIAVPEVMISACMRWRGSDHCKHACTLGRQSVEAAGPGMDASTMDNLYKNASAHIWDEPMLDMHSILSLTCTGMRLQYAPGRRAAACPAASGRPPGRSCVPAAVASSLTRHCPASQQRQCSCRQCAAVWPHAS